MGTRTISQQIDLTNQSEPVNKYITRINGDGIKVHAENNPTTNYTKIDVNGMEVYQNVNSTATKVASFGASGAQIGKNNSANINIGNNSIRGSGNEESFFFAFSGDGASHRAKIVPTYNLSGAEIPTSSSAALSYDFDISEYGGGSVIITAGTGVVLLKGSYGFLYGDSETATITVSGNASYSYIFKCIYDGDANFKIYTTSTIPDDEAVSISLYTYRTILAPTFTMGAGEASGAYAVSEGYETTASGNYSHAEGYRATAGGGESSHAEGRFTVASGNYSHAEGYRTTASQDDSHAEGNGSKATGYTSHAEGLNCEAKASRAHAQNLGTIAEYVDQTVIGRYNDNQSGTAFEIGNGTSSSAPSNALTVDWSGNVEAAGDITVGGHDYPIGQNLSGVWDQTSQSSSGTQMTKSIKLTPGIWMLGMITPTCSAAISYYFANISSRLTFPYFNLGTGGSGWICVEVQESWCADDTSVPGGKSLTTYVASGASTSVTYSNTTRGRVLAVRIA